MRLWVLDRGLLPWRLQGPEVGFPSTQAGLQGGAGRELSAAVERHSSPWAGGSVAELFARLFMIGLGSRSAGLSGPQNASAVLSSTPVLSAPAKLER